MTTSGVAFPQVKYDDIGQYVDSYAELTAAGWRSLDRAALGRAGKLLIEAYTGGKQVFVCGNGGSAAIANHLECDHVKGIHSQTDLSPQVRSLTGNVSLLTAIANDFSYDEVFSFPLERLGRPGDVLLTVSSSGNSPNILRAIERAHTCGLTAVALTGFEGGEARRLAHVSLHIDVKNYGVVEDIHQGIMHVLAQYIRQSRIDTSLIPTLRF